MLSICQRDRWLAMIARSGDEVVLAPVGETASPDEQVGLICDTVMHAFGDAVPAAIAGFNVPSAALRTGDGHRDAGKTAGPSRDRAGPPGPVSRPGGGAVAGLRLDESAMAVVSVIDHGITRTVHPDVLGCRLRIRPDQPHEYDRARRDALDQRLAHLPRGSASRPDPPAYAVGPGRTDNAPMTPPVIGDATGPASKVLSHGFEPGQRTSGVGALFLEPAKCRCTVAPRCANGVRSGAAPARVADSRLRFRAARASR